MALLFSFFFILNAIPVQCVKVGYDGTNLCVCVRDALAPVAAAGCLASAL